MEVLWVLGIGSGYSYVSVLDIGYAYLIVFDYLR